MIHVKHLLRKKFERSGYLELLSFDVTLTGTHVNNNNKDVVEIIESFILYGFRDSSIKSQIYKSLTGKFRKAIKESRI